MYHIHRLWLAPQAALHSRLLAFGLPTPKTVAPLPGLGTLTGLVGDVVDLVVVLAFAGLVVSAARLGIGHHTGNPGEVTKAKHGVLASLLAVLLAGAAKVLINFAAGVGAGI